MVQITGVGERHGSGRADLALDRAKEGVAFAPAMAGSVRLCHRHELDCDDTAGARTGLCRLVSLALAGRASLGIVCRCRRSGTAISCKRRALSLPEL